jgi:hypothetical protein
LEEEKKHRELSQLSNNQNQMEVLEKDRQHEGKTIKSLMANEWINDMAKNKQIREQRRQHEIQQDLARLEMERRAADDKQLQEKQKKN